MLGTRIKPRIHWSIFSFKPSTTICRALSKHPITSSTTHASGVGSSWTQREGALKLEIDDIPLTGYRWLIPSDFDKTLGMFVKLRYRITSFESPYSSWGSLRFTAFTSLASLSWLNSTAVDIITSPSSLSLLGMLRTWVQVSYHSLRNDKSGNRVLNTTTGRANHTTWA